MNFFRAAKMTPDYGYLRKGWLQKVTIFILSLTVQILVVRWFWLKNVQVSLKLFFQKISNRANFDQNDVFYHFLIQNHEFLVINGHFHI